MISGETLFMQKDKQVFLELANVEWILVANDTSLFPAVSTGMKWFCGWFLKNHYGPQYVVKVVLGSVRV